MTSFAIVGGGVAGVGAAVMLRRETYRDVTAGPYRLASAAVG